MLYAGGDVTRNCERVVLAGVLLCLCVAVYAAPEKDVLWETGANAQKTWQVGLAKLLVTKAPQFKELIELQRDLQLTMINMRSMKYYYVLETDPGRITREKGWSAWANFKWSGEDETKLEARDPGYAKLGIRKKTLREKNQGHPSWPGLRKVFGKIKADEEYQTLYKQLMGTLEEVDLSLKEEAADNKAAAPRREGAERILGK